MKPKAEVDSALPIPGADLTTLFPVRYSLAATFRLFWNSGSSSSRMSSKSVALGRTAVSLRTRRGPGPRGRVVGTARRGRVDGQRKRQLRSRRRHEDLYTGSATDSVERASSAGVASNVAETSPPWTRTSAWPASAAAGSATSGTRRQVPIASVIARILQPLFAVSENGSAEGGELPAYGKRCERRSVQYSS